MEWARGLMVVVCLAGCDALASTGDGADSPDGGTARPDDGSASRVTADDVIAEVTGQTQLTDCGCFGREAACQVDSASMEETITCLETAAAACEAAQARQLDFTTEGGRIATIFVSLPESVGCGVVVVNDASDDIFGNCE
ncbi:MAG: hypothetical protein PVI30_27260, partial [Myxococcales bacterium]